MSPFEGGVRLALTTLTVARVRGPESLDRRTAGWAMSLAPLVGLGLGGLLAGLLLGADALTAGPPLLAAALVVAGHALLTRGLHLDGLADLADGLGSYGSPERARAVMKQPDVGALGLAAVVLVLIVQVSALVAATTAGWGVTAVVVAVVTARLSVVVACSTGVPAASPDGLGALVAGTVARPVTAALTAMTLAGATLIGVADGAPVWLPTLAVVVGLGLAALLLRHAVRRVGGVTGDVLGAAVEVTTAVVLVVLAVSP